MSAVALVQMKAIVHSAFGDGLSPSNPPLAGAVLSHYVRDPLGLEPERVVGMTDIQHSVHCSLRGKEVAPYGLCNDCRRRDVAYNLVVWTDVPGGSLGDLGVQIILKGSSRRKVD